MKSKSAPSANDVSVPTMSFQHRRKGSTTSRRFSISSWTLQKFLKKCVQNSRCASRTFRRSGPYGTAVGPAASTNPIKSGGTAIHTSCPRRMSSRPTAAHGSISPRVP
ncbi:Uncharacterised protein [Mycobacteroides abscessus subsp. abscessus]|nr:Uncharacterised protein [Mycobacteroides abscessus subsp. abscessus]